MQMEDNEEYDSFQWNWDDLIRLFKTPVRKFDMFVIDFSPTTTEDKLQLEVPKAWAGYKLYTAAFFCRKGTPNGTEWFIYRVIYRMDKDVSVEEKPELYKKLLIKGYTALEVHKRTKNPFKYLKDLHLF